MKEDEKKTEESKREYVRPSMEKHEPLKVVGSPIPESYIEST